MPYRSVELEGSNSVHIISRAVDEKKIFGQEDDCLRFIFQMYAANVGRPSLNLRRRNVAVYANHILDGSAPQEELVVKEHEPLVHIFDFALNVTHYHLHLMPTEKNSVPMFVKKLNGGFAKYFNLKHHRVGTLFANRYRAVCIKDENQFDAVSRYVSVVNPLDMYQPGWREDGLRDTEGALEFLEKYRFSSFLDRVRKRESLLLAPEKVRAA